tara:strand:- start:157 stop:990 length:834 start_codon:yes stop_codon:yes gene_type:complete
MKVLILGSTGMLGHMVSSYFSKLNYYEVYNLSRRSIGQKNTVLCDVNNLNQFDKIIKNLNPLIIVNCIGLLINEANSNIKKSEYINSFFPKYLVENSNNKYRVIHISTDCVFSGRDGYYNEFSHKDATDVYGITKSNGEFNLSKHLTIRTSIIGPDVNKNGSGLFQWIINQTGEVKGFKNVKWTGVTTLELSKAIDYAINNSIDGIWNLSNQEVISKFELLEIIIDSFKLNKIKLIENSTNKSNKSLMSIRDINYIVPSYKLMINELREYIKSSKEY